MGRRIALDRGCADSMEPIQVVRLHAKCWCNIPTGLVKLKERLHAIGVAGKRERNSGAAVGHTASVRELLLATLFKLGIAAIMRPVLSLGTLRRKVGVKAWSTSSLWYS